MTVRRDHDRGTLPLDFHVKGIGRIRRASGTNDLETYNDIKAMFRMLRKKGRLDIIRAVAEGVVTPLEVWDRYRTDKLDRLPTAETMRRLWTHGKTPGVLAEWHRKIKTKHHANSVRQTWYSLERLEKKPNASIADLPRLVTKYRELCDAAGTGQMFKNARNNVRSYLKDTVGRNHPLYLAVAAIEPLPVDRAPGNPFTALGLAAFLDDLTRAHGPETATIARSLAFSGMRPVEYWAEWTMLAPDVARVRSAKQRRKKIVYRRVPVPAPLTVPTICRRVFEDRMRTVTRERVVYDLRRTYMHLSEQAGIPRSRRMAYLGHAAGDVSGRYEEHEVTEYLAGDVVKLRAYLTAAGHFDFTSDNHHDTTEGS